MRWFRLDQAGQGASREDGGNMITTALVAIGIVWLVFAVAYFVLARLGSVVWDVVARLRQ